ncbi:MAG: hypothetical protein ACREL3_06705 [Gemmatimonadales bacterium]
MARILIVEDSPDNMRLFPTVLAQKGHEVTELTGGEECSPRSMPPLPS